MNLVLMIYFRIRKDFGAVNFCTINAMLICYECYVGSHGQDRSVIFLSSWLFVVHFLNYRKKLFFFLSVLFDVCLIFLKRINNKKRFFLCKEIFCRYRGKMYESKCVMVPKYRIYRHSHVISKESIYIKYANVI